MPGNVEQRRHRCPSSDCCTPAPPSAFVGWGQQFHGPASDPDHDDRSHRSLNAEWSSERAQPDDPDLFQDRRAYLWDNHSDTATLRNDHGRFIGAKSWGHRRDDDRRHGSDHCEGHRP
ncbi:hypothetical protein [Streptomyces sp. NRRL B-3648]|uniref:hypothetical protein n=1 Tax=Streptomyces sp. NRRL B-3648 TaxID=1519493 RepID=UPI00099B4C0D|nr:hypothetical protein [Streptomyces sp. NRRL B-3648]